MASLEYCTARRIIAVFAVILALGSSPAIAADALAKAESEVVLSVTGEIGVRNSAEGADFDLAMIEAMPKATIKTTTPWTEGVTTFEGVPLGELLKRVEAAGTELNVKALNDYAAPVPTADAALGAILAYKVNGAYISVRDKGPLWLIYPFDDNPDLKREEIYSRAVWQIRSIDVVK